MSNQNNSQFDEQLCKERLIALGVGKKENKSGYTLKELSGKILEKTGISISSAQLSNLTSNTQSFNTSSETLFALATFFDVSTDYILGLSDSTSRETVDKKMSEKYGLSDKAMNNLAKWKQIEDAPLDEYKPFTEFKIIRAIMEDDSILTRTMLHLNNRFGSKMQFAQEIISKENYNKNVDSTKYLIAREFEIFAETLYKHLEEEWYDKMSKLMEQAEDIF